MKALITTVPFADKDPLPLQLLQENHIDYLINPLGKKLTEDELADMVGDFSILIAGTERISAKVMDSAKNLQLISRVGIGLDGVDLLAARERGIQVSYTPDAPSAAVSELTIGLTLDLLRSVHTANLGMHRGEWCRYFGRRLAHVTVGIIGVGRIGRSVAEKLSALGAQKILLNDIEQKSDIGLSGVEWAEKSDIYTQADVISLHVPLTSKTKNLITSKELATFKNDALLINTARGGVVNEADLYQALLNGTLGGAAIDVFEQEPYGGQLREIDNCLLTSHMGSMSLDCRAQMEIEATKEAVRFAQGIPLAGAVPEQEYLVQEEGL